MGERDPEAPKKEKPPANLRGLEPEVLKSLMKKHIAVIPAEIKYKIQKYTGISLQFSGITYKTSQYCSISAGKSLLKADIVALRCDGIISTALCQRLINRFELWGA